MIVIWRIWVLLVLNIRGVIKEKGLRLSLSVSTEVFVIMLGETFSQILWSVILTSGNRIIDHCCLTFLVIRLGRTEVGQERVAFFSLRNGECKKIIESAWRRDYGIRGGMGELLGKVKACGKKRDSLRKDIKEKRLALNMANIADSSVH
ncbi:hypothetical protein Ddye_022652 [Dipteronia dyeriana]|uniref:Uncharacterized protein n=1 Tax=Dipteronia dyeriana TaxID=168575 RepID=A0AAD9WRE2_9ROSI|nr:hypothetical protein Ddye_022652 [Dipteronia dyeriana]